MSYTANPFASLGEDGEERTRAPRPPKPTPQATPKAPQEAQPKAAPAKPSPTVAKKDDAKPKPQGDAIKGKTDAPTKKPAAESRPQQHQQQQQQKSQAPFARADSNYESEKPVRAPKDKRDTRDRAPRRGRQNDRLSGTGRPANENKRSGSGKNNWGKIDDQGQEVADATKEPTTTTEEKEEVVAPVEEVPETPKEPETKGYDEYLESIKDKKVGGVEQLKLRVAGEGVDQSAWSAYAPISKDDEADTTATKKKKATKKETSNGKEEKPKEEKVAVDKLFKVTVPPPQGIEERGRGGGRGGRGGKGPSRGGRGDRRQQPVDKSKAAFEHDAQSFPPLGGSSAPAASPAAPAPQQVNPPAVKA